MGFEGKVVFRRNGSWNLGANLLAATVRLFDPLQDSIA